MWTIIDNTIFVALSVVVLYLLVMSIAGWFYREPVTTVSPEGTRRRRIVVLIPAYREDAVIGECVESCISQDYDNAEVVVIADKMQPQTILALRDRGARVVEVHFEHSTKAKALNFAMREIGEQYDIALVMDADNRAEAQFLAKINAAFEQGAKALQTHRKAKNLQNSMAVLDAASEEINNSIFRRGHVALGLSSALIGSGMAFEYDYFKRMMSGVDAVGGFDKELEHKYLEQGIRIGYLDTAVVLDEKISRSADFSNQRRRWIAAQFHYLGRYGWRLPGAILGGKFDFADKIFQMMIPPRVLLLGIVGIIALAMLFIDWQSAIKWWILLVVLKVTLLAALPRTFYSRDGLRALLMLPRTLWLMVLTMFKLRGANKKFIHTEHGNTNSAK